MNISFKFKYFNEIEKSFAIFPRYCEDTERYVFLQYVYHKRVMHGFDDWSNLYYEHPCNEDSKLVHPVEEGNFKLVENNVKDNVVLHFDGMRNKALGNNSSKLFLK